MYYLYVLIGKKDRSVVIGCTGNVEKRLEAHNAGKLPGTRNKRPFELVYKEETKDKQAAFRLERFYKTPQGRRILKKKIDEAALGTV